jgi:enoyl-CoA hydratase/carnithine racemase
MAAMIHGAHVMLQSKNPPADLAFLRDVLGKPKVADAGGGWLIYALPPAEVAVHPSDQNDVHQLYLMCDDIQAFRQSMAKTGAPCSEVQAERWGLLVEVTMPGGGKLGVYEPKHASPNDRPRRAAKKTATKKAKPAAKKAATKKSKKRAR